jgi:small-conductance mechanosensitive channel
MDRFATALTLLLKDWIASLFGPQANQTLAGSITWADLGVTLCFLLLALLANGIAAALVRRRAASASTTAPAESIQRHVFHAVGRPLYVLVWAYGLYFAVRPLLLTLRPTEGLAVIGTFCGTVFDLGVFAVVFWAFFRFTRVLDARLTLWGARSSSKLDNLFLPLLGKSLRVIVPVLGIIFALPILSLPPAYADVVAKGTSILLIGAVTIILFQAVRVSEQALLARFDLTAADNLRARKVYTQVRVMTKMLDVIIGVFAVASVLMLFTEVRHVGASLLASAGIVGVIAGIAAQKTVSNLLAGFQIALAQPMRQDDVVIVEGEWGRVEEITLTYVVVHLWDDRRLVLPLSYFIEKPFQNWTRASARLLGSVFVWVDYSFPVDQARTALKAIIEASPVWDKRFWNLQVTDANDKSMQLRVLATAADSSAAFDLRCEIREKFIAYIQQHHPATLPQLRAQWAGSAPASASQS